MMRAANIHRAILLLAMASMGCSVNGIVGFHADDAAVDPGSANDSSIAQSGGDDAFSDDPNDAGQPSDDHLDDDGGEATDIDDLVCDDLLCLDAGNGL